MRAKRKAPPKPVQPHPRPFKHPTTCSPSVLLLWVYRYSSSRLCLNVVREVTTYYPCLIFLAGIYKTRLYLVDIHSCMVVSVHSLDMTGQRLFFLKQNSLLCAGYQFNYEMKVVNFFPIVIKKLPQQITGNFPYWFQVYNELLYAFPLQLGNSEKYSFATKQWEVIPHNNFLHTFPLFSVTWKDCCWFYNRKSTDRETGEFLRYDFTRNTFIARVEDKFLHINIANTVVNGEGNLLIIGHLSCVHHFNLETITYRCVGHPKHPKKQSKWQGYSLVVGEKMYWLNEESPELRKISMGKKIEKKAVKLILPKP